MDAGSIPADSTQGSQLWRVVPAKRDSLATAGLSINTHSLIGLSLGWTE